MVEKFTQTGVDYNKNPADSPAEPEVPAWMPEKFVREGKPDYKALADSYQEAQKFISGKQPPPPKETPAPKAAPEPKKGDGTNPWAEENINKWAQEAAENGGYLSEESYAQIPVPRPFVDMWIQTMADKAQSGAAKDVEEFGGQEGWQEVQSWASANYTQEEKDAWAQAQRVGGPLKKMAIQNLKARYAEENGTPAPRRIAGGPGVARGGAPFTKMEQVVKAMADPRYKIGTATYDSEYADDVRARVAAMK